MKNYLVGEGVKESEKVKRARTLMAKSFIF